MDEVTSPRRARPLEPLVSKALELRDAGRADWLTEACQDDPEAAAEVRAVVERAALLPDMVRSAATRDPLIGRSLGERYRVVERLGAGAMGIVYLAEDQELRRRVACKVVRHGLMAPAQALERFAREARAMAAVQHPSVITIYDRGRTDEDEVYIVMELIEGAPLGELIEAAAGRDTRERPDDNAWVSERFGIARRDEPSFLRTAVRWTADLAQGLQAVHEAGVLHRDIKPSNVIVRRDGRPTLLDFGIAQLEDHATLTRGVTSVGTPCYLPPEALDREAKRTAASDVYSLTATLYHLLTLRAPYEGTPTQVLTAIATREPVPASKVRPGLPRDLQAILDKGMHRRPLARYATAAELEADLRAFLEFRPIVARPVSPVRRAARRLRRSRAAWGATLTLVVVAVVALGQVWRAARTDARAARFSELYGQLPPNFTIVEAQNRVAPLEADRTATRDLLDRAVAVSASALPIKLLRGSYRFDHGDSSGALADIAAVAEEVGSPFGQALLERYEALAAGGTTALPAPRTGVEVYLAAYEALRDGNAAAARALLQDPRVREIPHAEELRLALTNLRSKDRAEQQRIALEGYSDVLRLEHMLGRRTATSAHLIGRMLPSLQRYADALEACEEGIELAQRSHVIRVNAGYSALRLGSFERATEHLQVAIELRPTYAQPVEQLIWVYIERGTFDAALQLVDEAAPRLVPASATWQDYWTAVIQTYAALSADAARDPGSAEQRIALAQRHFELAQKAGMPLESNTAAKLATKLAVARAKGEAGALLSTLIALVQDEPTNLWRLGLLLEHFPSELGQAHTAAVRALLSKLRATLGGGADQAPAGK